MVKYNDVRFCFLDIIETNTMVQLDFDFDARFGNYDFFKTCVHAHVFILFLPLHIRMHPLASLLFFLSLCPSCIQAL